MCFSIIYIALKRSFMLYLTIKSEWASCIMSFSDRMCSCCLVSTMCRFFKIFMANVLFSSLFSWTCGQRNWVTVNSFVSMDVHPLCSHYNALFPTSSTRPKPPTPRVSMMLKSARLRLKKNAFSASYLLRQRKGEERKHWRRIRDKLKDERTYNPLSTTWGKKYPFLPELICLQILED